MEVQQSVHKIFRFVRQVHQALHEHRLEGAWSLRYLEEYHCAHQNLHKKKTIKEHSRLVESTGLHYKARYTEKNVEHSSKREMEHPTQFKAMIEQDSWNPITKSNHEQAKNKQTEPIWTGKYLKYQVNRKVEEMPTMQELTWVFPVYVNAIKAVLYNQVYTVLCKFSPCIRGRWHGRERIAQCPTYMFRWKGRWVRNAWKRSGGK